MSQCAVGILRRMESRCEGELKSALNELAAIAADCSEPNWNNEVSVPVTMLMVGRVSDLLKDLPLDIPVPELAPEPDGSISLDWGMKENGAGQQFYSVSVGESEWLAVYWRRQARPPDLLSEGRLHAWGKIPYAGCIGLIASGVRMVGIVVE